MLQFLPKLQTNNKGIFYCSIGWRTMRVRARVRAETTHVLQSYSKNDKRQVQLMIKICWRLARAQLRARLHGARQSIFPRKEILFGHLVAFLAQKAKFSCQNCCRLLLSHTKIIVNT